MNNFVFSGWPWPYQCGIQSRSTQTPSQAVQQSFHQVQFWVRRHIERAGNWALKRTFLILAASGVVTVRDEYLLFVKVSLMMPIRVMRAFADVTHSLAVAGAVLNTNLVCRRFMFSAIILTTSFASVFTTQQPSRCWTFIDNVVNAMNGTQFSKQTKVAFSRVK